MDAVIPMFLSGRGLRRLAQQRAQCIDFVLIADVSFEYKRQRLRHSARAANAELKINQCLQGIGQIGDGTL